MAQPFFKGNYGSALARVDTRPIIEAGRAQGAMYANLGNEVAGAIKQYGLNKQERAKLTGEIEQDIMQYGEQLTMTGNEEFDKKNSSAIEKFRRGDSNMTDLRGLSGQIGRIKANDLADQAQVDAALKSKLLGEQIRTSEEVRKTKAQRDTYKKQAFGDLVRTGEEAIRNLQSGDMDFEDLTNQTAKIIQDLGLLKREQGDPTDYSFNANEESQKAITELEAEELRNKVDLGKEELSQKQREGKFGEFLNLEEAQDAAGKSYESGFIVQINAAPGGGYNITKSTPIETVSKELEPIPDNPGYFTRDGDSNLYRRNEDGRIETVGASKDAQIRGQEQTLVDSILDDTKYYRMAMDEWELDEDSGMYIDPDGDTDVPQDMKKEKLIKRARAIQSRLLDFYDLDLTR